MKVGGGFYTIRFADGDGDIKVKEHRLFAAKGRSKSAEEGKETDVLVVKSGFIHLEVRQWRIYTDGD